MTQYRIAPGGTPKVTVDATLNDSDKSFTVPTGKVWILNEIWADLVATATVGSRVFVIMITDGTNTIYRSVPITVTASQKGSEVISPYFANYSSSIPTRQLDNTTNNAQVTMFVPLQPLKAGYVIRVYDSAAIDAAADDLTVVLQYTEYEA